MIILKLSLHQCIYCGYDKYLKILCILLLPIDSCKGAVKYDAQ